MASPLIFATAAEMHQYILGEAGPGTLILVSHDRLVRQLWHRQRQQMLAQGRAAWEPFPIVTLNQWYQELFESLWTPLSLASDLERLQLWWEAMQAGPRLEEFPLDLALAAGLDETHAILTRHQISPGEASGPAAPLISWRRQISQIFENLLSEKHLLTPGQLPTFLLPCLLDRKLSLPTRILAVGFEALAPAEEVWLQELAKQTEFQSLLVKGHSSAVQAAVTLPDREQEMQWVAARLLEVAHQEKLPRHRLAVTSPVMDDYAPRFKRVLAELVGPPGDGRYRAYTFSLGIPLAEQPLFLAGILPLLFWANGERRADLVSLLLSPFYSRLVAHPELGIHLDRLWRDQGIDHGWPRLRQAWEQGVNFQDDTGRELLTRIEDSLRSLQDRHQAGRDWATALNRIWQALGFPGTLSAQEYAMMTALDNLLQDLARTLGSAPRTASEFLAWLRHGAQRRLIPESNRGDAGVQILGLLEIRGLDFDQVFCLGMNAAAFPWAPRDLPFLETCERRQVLGGTIASQYRYAEQIFATLLGVSPHLTLTRPHQHRQEPLVATPLWAGEWQDETIAPLSQPEPAWLRVPAIRQALRQPQGTPLRYQDRLVTVPLPPELSISAIDTALACPCWFFLENLLGVSVLADVEVGIIARERGLKLHEILKAFVDQFKAYLERYSGWDDRQARAELKAVVARVLGPHTHDLHWEVEQQRWLAEDEENPGFLWQWLIEEQQRHAAGWRWQAAELKFSGLRHPDWPFALNGRIDRLDWHPDEGFILWDYKSGKLPRKQHLFDLKISFQLPGYLLALKYQRIKLHEPRHPALAGYIQLRSGREVKFETWRQNHQDWHALLSEWETKIADLGKRLQQGDFRPDPQPRPEGRERGACQFCPYKLLCGYQTQEMTIGTDLE